MKGNLVGMFVGLFIVAIVGIMVAVPVISELTTGATESTNVPNESINFVLNNTDYTLGNVPIENVNALYAQAAHTYAINTTRYLVTGNAIRIYTNGTTALPNITNGSTVYYYADYDYYGSGYVNNTASRTILVLLPLFVILALLVIITKIAGLW